MSAFTEIRRYTKDLVVLYVEDDNNLRDATVSVFENYFKKVDTAVDGQDGFQKYKSYYDKNSSFYDIVITDIRMPNINGIEFCKKLREFNDNQIIIINSAYHDPDDLIELINIKIYGFIFKPLDVKQLNSVLLKSSEEILDSKRRDKDEEELKISHELSLKREEQKEKEIIEKEYALNEIKKAIENSEIVSRTDVNGVITYVNDYFCDISGYERDELIGKKHSIVKHPDIASSFYAKLWRTITAGKVYKGIYKNITKDGKTYYLKGSVSPIMNREGEVIEYISIKHNVSELFENIEKLMDSDKAKDDFIRNISHELKTPLNSMVSVLPLIKKRVDDKKTLELLDMVNSGSIQLNKIVNYSIDIVQLTNNEIKIEKKSNIIRDTLSTLFVSYSRELKEKEIDFSTFIDENISIEFTYDENYLLKALSYILDNAIKFTPHGGKIRVKVEMKDDKLIVHIRDSGVGISKENYENIFNIYFQVDSSLSRGHEGNGIGLYLAKKIVLLMDGTIKVRSELGKGSLFTVEV